MKRSYAEYSASSAAAAAAMAAATTTTTASSPPPASETTTPPMPWRCRDCSAENPPEQIRCLRCRTNRGDTTDTGEGRAWREVMDRTTQSIYYWNTETGETSWQRPACLGPAPIDTGHFSRGGGDMTISLPGRQFYADRNAALLTQWAAKQVASLPTKGTIAADATSSQYNIWSGKYLGNSGNSFDGVPADNRCCVDLHGGRTKGTDIHGSTGTAWFCIHFARGGCALGKDCTFIHRTPLVPEDSASANTGQDIFGRERHRRHRQDMGGVGGFDDDCRTLYVGGIKLLSFVKRVKDLARSSSSSFSSSSSSSSKEVEKQQAQRLAQLAVESAFAEWGEVEHVNVVWRLAAAFVRYRHRVSAEFAKEAMHRQHLTGEERIRIEKEEWKKKKKKQEVGGDDFADSGSGSGSGGGGGNGNGHGSGGLVGYGHSSGSAGGRGGTGEEDEEWILYQARTVHDGSLLNVRWAYDDPNPKAKRARIESDRKAALAAVAATQMAAAAAAATAAATAASSAGDTTLTLTTEENPKAGGAVVSGGGGSFRITNEGYEYGDNEGGTSSPPSSSSSATALGCGSSSSSSSSSSSTASGGVLAGGTAATAKRDDGDK